MKFPLVRDLAAEGFPVRLTCGVLGFSPRPSTSGRPSRSATRDSTTPIWSTPSSTSMATTPSSATASSPTSSSTPGTWPRERRVWRLCSRAQDLVDDHEEGPEDSGKRPGPAVHDDLVQRNFTAPAPDQVWLTDITEHRTEEGKLYACAIKDVCSNRIVGYATA